MSYLDSSDALLIALTRQKRAALVARRSVMDRARQTLYFRTKERLSKAQAHPDPRDQFWQNRRRKRPPAGVSSVQSETFLSPWAPWWRLWRAQDGHCYLCGIPFSDDHWATEDHVVPRSRKGKDRGNICLAHQGCNTWKGNRKPYPCELIALDAVNAKLDWYAWELASERASASGRSFQAATHTEPEPQTP